MKGTKGRRNKERGQEGNEGNMKEKKGPAREWVSHRRKEGALGLGMEGARKGRRRCHMRMKGRGGSERKIIRLHLTTTQHHILDFALITQLY